MPWLLSCEVLCEDGKRLMITVFHAVDRAPHFLGDLFKGGAVKDLAAEDLPIQRVKDALIDERAHLGSGERMMDVGSNHPLFYGEIIDRRCGG